MATDDAFYRWGASEPISTDNLTKRPFDLHLRVKALEAVGEAVETIQREVNDTVLAQTEDVLAGLRAQLAAIVQLDWLTAVSATPITLVAGQERALIIPEDQRDLFAPGPYAVVQRTGDPTVYAVVQTLDYDRTLGQFDFDVVTVAGAAGTYSDWSIGALAGSTLAQMTLLTQGLAAKAATDADAVATAADRVATHADTVATAADRTATHADRLAADTSATAAHTSETNAAGSATAAAASAASIAGGPVTSVNGKTGIVSLGVADIAGAARVSWKPISDASYTILAADRTIAAIVAFTAPRTWTLPLANSVPAGTSLRVLDQAGGISAINTLTLARSESDTLNGAVNATFAAPNTDFLITSDGVSHWTYGIQGLARGGTGQVASSSADLLVKLGAASAASVLTPAQVLALMYGDPLAQ